MLKFKKLYFLDFLIKFQSNYRHFCIVFVAQAYVCNIVNLFYTKEQKTLQQALIHFSKFQTDPLALESSHGNFELQLFTFDPLVSIPVILEDRVTDLLGRFVKTSDQSWKSVQRSQLPEHYPLRQIQGATSKLNEFRMNKAQLVRLQCSVQTCKAIMIVRDDF